MNHIEYHLALENLICKLQKGATLTPEELSKSLSITTRTVRRIMSALRDSGYNIKFDRSANTYRIIEVD